MWGGELRLLECVGGVLPAAGQDGLDVVGEGAGGAALFLGQLRQVAEGLGELPFSPAQIGDAPCLQLLGVCDALQLCQGAVLQCLEVLQHGVYAG